MPLQIFAPIRIAAILPLLIIAIAVLAALPVDASAESVAGDSLRAERPRFPSTPT